MNKFCILITHSYLLCNFFSIWNRTLNWWTEVRILKDFLALVTKKRPSKLLIIRLSKIIKKVVMVLRLKNQMGMSFRKNFMILTLSNLLINAEVIWQVPLWTIKRTRLNLKASTKTHANLIYPRGRNPQASFRSLFSQAWMQKISKFGYNHNFLWKIMEILNAFSKQCNASIKQLGCW